tara:strand:- start:628 stop:1047 length:420 start_codon:yes stop_codon:yes gene_type:complete
MTGNSQFLSFGSKCRIPVSEISWKFGPTGGPGGQHANRVNTRVEATLDLASTQSVEEDIKKILVTKLGSVMKVTVDQHRSQFRNRELALTRIESQLQKALIKETPRRPTKPKRSSIERRLKNKRKQSERKANRRRVWDD